MWDLDLNQLWTNGSPLMYTPLQCSSVGISISSITECSLPRVRQTCRQRYWYYTLILILVIAVAFCVVAACTPTRWQRGRVVSRWWRCCSGRLSSLGQSRLDTSAWIATPSSLFCRAASMVCVTNYSSITRHAHRHAEVCKSVHMCAP